MRLSVLSVICLLLVSCGPPVTLYTDETFRNAASEVAAAWEGTAPWKPASTKNLPPGSGSAALETELSLAAPTSIILVGMALSDTERTALQSAHPQMRMVFFTSSDKPTAFAEITVKRQDAWSTVAAAAAPGTATVFYPTDVKSEEMEAFETTWKKAGGGALTIGIGAQAEKLSGTPTTVFHWAGPELDGPVQNLGPAVKVHGNPGTPRAAGASGLTWGLRKTGLGDFLWQAALDPEKKRHFLPLETVLERR